MDVRQMLDRAESWTFRQDIQVDDDGAIVARVLTCNQEPRISVVSRYDRKREKVSQIWRVDGLDHTSVNTALAKLILDEVAQ